MKKDYPRHSKYAVNMSCQAVLRGEDALQPLEEAKEKAFPSDRKSKRE